MSIAPQEPAHTAPVFQPCTLVASGSHSWWLPHVESKDDRKCVQRGFSPDFTDILGHVFAFLALNRIAHLLLHILTPDKSYDPPLPYFKLLCFTLSGTYLSTMVVWYSVWHFSSTIVLQAAGVPSEHSSTSTSRQTFKIVLDHSSKKNL